jgi:hypothetical protein
MDLNDTGCEGVNWIYLAQDTKYQARRGSGDKATPALELGGQIHVLTTLPQHPFNRLRGPGADMNVVTNLSGIKLRLYIPKNSGAGIDQWHSTGLWAG